MTDKTIATVSMALVKAVQKHPLATRNGLLLALAEEVGEVAQVANDFDDGTISEEEADRRSYEETSHVMVVASRYMEYLENKMKTRERK